MVPAVWWITGGRIEAAFWLFLAAGLSDAVDGFVAKRFNARTNFGAYLDPVADKVLLTGVYLALATQALLAPWLVALVVSRDILIVAGVAVMQRRNALFKARPLLIGKVNTLGQIVLAVFVLADASGLLDLSAAARAIAWLVAATTVASGLAYLVQAVRVSSSSSGTAPAALAAGEGSP